MKKNNEKNLTNEQLAYLKYRIERAKEQGLWNLYCHANTVELADYANSAWHDQFDRTNRAYQHWRNLARKEHKDNETT